MSTVVVSIKDHDGEIGTTSVSGIDVTAANYDTQKGLADALEAAIMGVSVGAEKKYSFISDIENFDPSPPAEQYAQRETKWLVRVKDTVNFKTFKFEIPCADLDLLDSTNPKIMDITTALGPGESLVDAVEAFMRSPYGNAVEVLEVLHVGRNL